MIGYGIQRAKRLLLILQHTDERQLVPDFSQPAPGRPWEQSFFLAKVFYGEGEIEQVKVGHWCHRCWQGSEERRQDGLQDN